MKKNDKSNLFNLLTNLTCKRVNPESNDMRSSWRNGWISSGLSDNKASSNSSWWKSNNWKASQKIRANNDIYGICQLFCKAVKQKK